MEANSLIKIYFSTDLKNKNSEKLNNGLTLEHDTNFINGLLHKINELNFTSWCELHICINFIFESNKTEAVAIKPLVERRD